MARAVLIALALLAGACNSGTIKLCKTDGDCAIVPSTPSCDVATGMCVFVSADGGEAG